MTIGKNGNDFWSSLSSAQRNVLINIGNTVKFKRKQKIYEPDQPCNNVYILESGLVRLIHSIHKNRAVTLRLIHPGSLFGEASLMGIVNHVQYAESLSDSQALAIPAQAMKEIMLADPEMQALFIEEIWRSKNELESRIEEITFRDIPARLANILIWLSNEYGSKTGQGIAIQLRLTHKELASIIGATRETITLTMKNLKDSGYIAYDGRMVIIQNLNGLREYAESASRKQLITI